MKRLWLVPVLALTLSACSGNPRDERRGDVEAVIDAANAGDAAALRDAVADFRSTLRSQVASGELDRAEGERLNAIALRLLENSSLLEQAPAPSPVPTQEPEPEPTQEPEPEPTQEEPEPEPTEAPEEEPEPEQTQEEEPPVEPEPEQTLEIEPFPEESPPSAQSQSGSGSGGTAEPTPAA